MPAFVYVRKSVVNDETTTLSPQVQEERCRALASAHGDDDPTVLRDIGISGAKVEKRPSYMELLHAVESGDATAVYAYDLSRLHRNTKEALRFFELCRDRNVAVRLVADSIDTSNASGRLMLTVLAAMNAWTSEVTSEKIKASLARREQETGKRNGGKFYPHPEIVVAAFRQTGSLTRAARKLAEDGVPTRNGKSRAWSATAVRSIVRRSAPELIVPGENRGRPTSRPFRFARLLRCSECGGRMTPSYDRRQDYVSYYCQTANVTPHGRKRVPESALVAAIQPEAERWIARSHRVRPDGATRATADLDALERQVEQLAARGLDVTSLRADLEARRAMLDTGRRIRRVALDDIGLAADLASGDPAKVNAFLRRVFDHVVVDMSGGHERGQASVVEFAWIDPTLRGDEEATA
jgi:DNA invertase Pin-like site-specific DNA recombinase